MVGINPEVITQKLNVNPNHLLVKQKCRKFAPEPKQVINEEVQNLLVTCKIRKAKSPNWPANMVVVPKTNEKWHVCIDFTDLNKACPKDPFLLPHIDTIVDATVSHEMLTFMDTRLAGTTKSSCTLHVKKQHLSHIKGFIATK